MLNKLSLMIYLVCSSDCQMWNDMFSYFLFGPPNLESFLSVAYRILVMALFARTIYTTILFYFFKKEGQALILNLGSLMEASIELSCKSSTCVRAA